MTVGAPLGIQKEILELAIMYLETIFESARILRVDRSSRQILSAVDSLSQGAKLYSGRVGS